MGSMPLRGRVALVTGAGSPSGIGFAVAQALARDGARVAITSTTERIHQRAAELTADGAEAAGWIRDLTDLVGVRSLIEEIRPRFGSVDVLVNSAGMSQTGKDDASPLFHEIAPELWDRQIAITLTTAFNVTWEVVGDLIAQRWGRIITVSSVTGPVASYPGQSPYAAAKAGLDGPYPQPRCLSSSVGTRSPSTASHPASRGNRPRRQAAHHQPRRCRAVPRPILVTERASSARRTSPTQIGPSGSTTTDLSYIRP